MPGVKQYLTLCRPNSIFVSFHYPVESIPINEVVRFQHRGGATDELHPFTKSSETNATTLLSGIRHATIFRTLLNEDFNTNMVKNRNGTIIFTKINAHSHAMTPLRRDANG